MAKCTPCEIANNGILLISKERAIKEAIKKGRELGETFMAIGICQSGDKERYTYAVTGESGGLKQVEYISVS